MRVLRWCGFAALLVPACVGALAALLFVGFSFMGFDSPKSDGQMWPSLLVAGAVVAALGSAFLVLNGVVLMIAGRARASYLSLAAPAALAVAFVAWIGLISP